MNSAETSTTTTDLVLEEATLLVADLSFTTVAAVFQRLDSMRLAKKYYTDTLIVGSLTLTGFKDIEAERDRRGWHSKLFYLASQKCAIITVPSGPHETSHRYLYEAAIVTMSQMGVLSEWGSSGGRTLSGDGGFGGGSSGEGDSCGGPRSRALDGNWPTLVVEAGVSQSMTALRVKTRWWFGASNGRMKIVVLVKFTVETSAITIEKWIVHSKGPHQRPGATATRGFLTLHAPIPARVQEIFISWTGSEPVTMTPFDDRRQDQFTVSGGPLLLGFEDLFLRPPMNSGEHDIMIGEDQLRDMASVAWRSA